MIHFLKKIFGSSPNNGILLICNSLLIGFILYYCIQLIFSTYINSKIENPLKFIFKILIISILINNSYFLCEKILNLNFLLSSSIRAIGENIFNKNICFSQLINELNSTITIENNYDFLSFNGILKSLSSIGLLNLIFTYSLRYIMIKAFILLFPFGLLTLLNQNTSWIFKSIFRSFLSLILIQQLISIILLIVFSINFDSNIFSKFMYIGSIYALIKANSYVREIFGGISTEVHNNFSKINYLRK